MIIPRWLTFCDYLSKRVTGSLGTPNSSLRENNVITRRQDWKVTEEAKIVSLTGREWVERAVVKVLFSLFKRIHLPQNNPCTEPQGSMKHGLITTSFENEEEKIQESWAASVDRDPLFSWKPEVTSSADSSHFPWVYLAHPLQPPTFIHELPQGLLGQKEGLDKNDSNILDTVGEWFSICELITSFRCFRSL